jgi:hypothetical protein
LQELEHNRLPHLLPPQEQERRSQLPLLNNPEIYSKPLPKLRRHQLLARPRLPDEEPVLEETATSSMHYATTLSLGN